MKRIFLFGFVLMFFACVSCWAVTNEPFSNGLAAARSGNFSEAATQFEISIRQQPSVGALLNLGIAEWQAGHAGPAILAWERAAWIAPRDERVNNNLKLARAVAQMEAPELRWFEKISVVLPAAMWPWISGASLWLIAVALLLPRVLRWRKSAWQQPLVALGVVVFVFSLTANFGVASRADLGVVTKKNVPLRLTPTQGSELIATLNGGETFRLVRTRGNYYFIRTTMTAGWVERGQVGMICE